MDSLLTRPESIELSLCEVWPRDGLQGYPMFVPTADKLAVIKAAVDAGVRELDVTAFVSPKVTAQFADSTELLAQLRAERLSARFRVLAVNRVSIDRIAADATSLEVVNTCGFPISASEPHNLANVGRTHAEHQRELAVMIEACFDLGLEPLLCVATAFGCPLAGPVPSRVVLELARWGFERGVRRIMLGDTTGMADPAHAFRLFTRVREALPGAELIAHFHDTRGNGIANTLAAIEAGVRVVDAALGGMGGEPSTVEQNHAGESGNVCTEDLVATLDRMGIRTGLDVERVLAAGRLAEKVIGATLRSQVLRAGLAARAVG